MSSESSDVDSDAQDQVPEPQDQEPKRRRRWFTISLRAFLLLCIGGGAIAGYYAIEYRRSVLEQVAQKVIKKAGGQTIVDENQKTLRVYLGMRSVNDEYLEELVDHMVHMRSLSELDLVNTPITDEGLLQIDRLQQLKLLYIFRTHATEEGIEQLRTRMPNLDVKESTRLPIASGMAMYDIFEHSVAAVAIAGKSIFAGSGTGELHQWSLDGPMHRTTMAHDDWTFSVVVHDGIVYSGGGDDRVRIQMPDETTRFLDGHTDDVHVVRVFNQEQRLASVSDDHTLRIWDLERDEVLHTIAAHESTIPGMDVSHDGTRIATAGRDDLIKIWDAENGEHLATIAGHGDDVMSVDFHPSGEFLASASYDRTVRIWRREGDQWKPVARMDAGKKRGAFSVAFSPDGTTLAAGADDGIRLFDWRRQTQQRHLTNHRWIAQVAFGDTGNQLISGSADGTVMIHNLNRPAPPVMYSARYGERGLILGG